jgi:predicted nucleic acid-binding protein
MIRRRVGAPDAAALIALLRDGAIVAPDVAPSLHRSIDPGDDYLLALAASRHAVLVSGDTHLLDLADALPVRTAHAFLDALASA